MKSEPQVCILSTGKMMDFNMAENHLKENNIPFYKQMISSTGMILAMPLQPTMGPGTFFELVVPKKYSDNATKILSGLPIDMTTRPDLWHFSPKSKIIWKMGVIFISGLGILFFILNIFK